MQTLIINGSPHKNGDTMTLVNEMTKHLHGFVLNASCFELLFENPNME